MLSFDSVSTPLNEQLRKQFSMTFLFLETPQA